MLLCIYSELLPSYWQRVGNPKGSPNSIIPKRTGQGKLGFCFHGLIKKCHTVSKWAVTPRISCSESSLSRTECAAELVSQEILRNLNFQLISKAGQGLKLRVLWHPATFDKAFENQWEKAILKTTLFVSTRKFLKIILNRLTKKVITYHSMPPALFS